MSEMATVSTSIENIENDNTLTISESDDIVTSAFIIEEKDHDDDIGGKKEPILVRCTRIRTGMRVINFFL